MAKKIITISVAVAVFNEQRSIGRCLASVKGLCDEIVVVDGGSTDRTLEIASRFTNRIIQTDNPPIFHINKQKALDECRGTWILQLDADEVVTEELADEIRSIVSKKTLQEAGFFIARRNYFWGHFMKKGGQYPDYVIRFVKRGKAVFPCKSVHEQIAVSGPVGYLKNPMLHYSYQTRRDYWKKAATYTSLTAREIRTSVRSRPFLSSLTYLIIKPLSTFVSIFIRHKGFVDGGTGFEFALYSALHFPIAYGKALWQ